MKKKLAFILIVLAVGAVSGCAPKKDAYLPAPVYFEKGMSSYFAGMYGESETNFKAILESDPLSPEAVEAMLILADVYYTKEEYESAALYYTNFYSMHPGHPRAEYALFQKGMSNFLEMGPVDRDLASAKKALIAFEDLTRDYPGGVYAPKAADMVVFIKKRLAENELIVGRFYLKAKNYKGALLRFGYLLDQYPDSGFSDSALFFIGETYGKLGETRLADEAYLSLVNSYPESRYVSKARNRISAQQGS